MKQRVIIGVFTFLLIGIIAISASSPPPDPERTPLIIPPHFPKLERNPEKDNPLTKEGFALGKKIFYDAGLSGDGQVSCASCHQPYAAFANYDHDFSHGAHNTFTNRNAPALINLAWAKELHWDGAINHLEVQPLAPFASAVEMGGNLDTILFRLKADTAYLRMFTGAFGSSDITSKRMLKALAQFTISLISATSKYDRVIAGKDTFQSYEKKGYALFKANCTSCHKEPLLTDHSFRNNGMKLNKFGDKGRMTITGKKSDSLKFKVPTLRNAALTLPYMHDGSLKILDDVIEHYVSLDTTNPALDPVLRKKKIRLTSREKKELLLFLYTLTDNEFARNKRFLPDFISQPAAPHPHPAP